MSALGKCRMVTVSPDDARRAMALEAPTVQGQRCRRRAREIVETGSGPHLPMCAECAAEMRGMLR